MMSKLRLITRERTLETNQRLIDMLNWNIKYSNTFMRRLKYVLVREGTEGVFHLFPVL